MHISEATQEKEFLDLVYSNLAEVDVIILQDYNKGVLTPFVIENIIKKANKLNIPTIVDPKTRNFLSYKNCAIFKPNLKEIKTGCNINFDKNNMAEINSATKDLPLSMTSRDDATPREKDTIVTIHKC